jgi:hypothetical protein
MLVSGVHLWVNDSHVCGVHRGILDTVPSLDKVKLPGWFVALHHKAVINS